MGSPQLIDFLRNVGAWVTRFGLVDIALVLLIFVGLLKGYRKGFATEFNNILQLVFVITVTIEYSDTILRFFSIQSPILNLLLRLLIFLILAFACYSFGKVFLQGVAKIFTIQFATIIDKIGGALLGGVCFVVLLSFFSYFLLLFPGNWVRESYEKYNLSGSLLVRLSPEIHQKVRQLIPDPIKGQPPSMTQSAAR